MRWFLENLWTISSNPANWINIGLFVVGFAYTIFAACQWLAIRRQAKIADRAAKAATEANRIASETLVITRRARISIDEVRIFTTEDKPAVNFRLVNSGEVPATGIRKYARRRVAAVGDDEVKPDDYVREPNPEGASEIVDPPLANTNLLVAVDVAL